jgi:hypothetical protein
MILTYSGKDDVEIKPFKLIANRKGIKRIEKINLSGR